MRLTNLRSRSIRAGSDVAEAVDRVQVLGPELGGLRGDAEPLLGREAEHADLALVEVLAVPR